MNIEKLSIKLAKNLEYYVNDPNKRCVNRSGECTYSGKMLGLKTKGCFVGSLMPAKTRLSIDKNIGLGGVDTVIQKSDVFGIKIPKFIKDHSNVMTSFQSLHDNSFYWEDGGLSKLGVSILKVIINKHSLNEDPFKKFLTD